MSGMAILLLCAMQADDSGWRTSIPSPGVPTSAAPTSGMPASAVPRSAIPSSGVPMTAPPTTGVPSASAPNTASGSVIGLMQQAEQAVREGVQSAGSALWPSTGAGTPPGTTAPAGPPSALPRAPGESYPNPNQNPNYGTSVPRAPSSAAGAPSAYGGSSTASWPEVHEALGQPVGQVPRSTAVQDDVLRNRIRGAQHATTQPPTPPRNVAGSSRYSSAIPSADSPPDGSAYAAPYGTAPYGAAARLRPGRSSAFRQPPIISPVSKARDTTVSVRLRTGRCEWGKQLPPRSRVSWSS